MTTQMAKKGGHIVRNIFLAFAGGTLLLCCGVFAWASTFKPLPTGTPTSQPLAVEVTATHAGIPVAFTQPVNATVAASATAHQALAANTVVAPTLAPATRAAPTRTLAPLWTPTGQVAATQPPAATQAPANTATIGPRVRIGAMCGDGTLSDATGSGACSSHKKVQCWRYSDGTCTNP